MNNKANDRLCGLCWIESSSGSPVCLDPENHKLEDKSLTNTQTSESTTVIQEEQLDLFEV